MVNLFVRRFSWLALLGWWSLGCRGVQTCDPNGNRNELADTKHHADSGRKAGKTNAKRQDVSIRDQLLTAQNTKDVLPHRDLWFTKGPGHNAILARERGDYKTARQQLDLLLADSTLSSEERSIAEFLRALEELRESKPLAAAERLGRALELSQKTLAPLAKDLRIMQAQAYLDGDQPERALSLINTEPGDEEFGGQILLIRAAVHLHRGDEEAARQLYDLFLQSDEGSSSLRAEVKLKLAILLANLPDTLARKRATSLLEELVVEFPLSHHGAKASEKLKQLKGKKRGPDKDGDDERLFHRKELSTARQHLRRRNYKAAVKSVDRLLSKSKKASDTIRCEALYIRGSAIFKQRKRDEARPSFEKAARYCKRSKSKELEVKSRYQASRGYYASGEYKTAANNFTKLAKDHPDHSYADDSWILAGESWELAEDVAKAVESYEQALRLHPKGDMGSEARRRLLLLAFSDNQIEHALQLLDRSLANRKISAHERAKLTYFRGRALHRLGQEEQAQAEYLKVLALRPLSYPSLQAISRLREISPPAYEKGLRQFFVPPKKDPGRLDLPSDPNGKRIALLAQLGLAQHTEEALRRAELEGWPAVVALSQSGAWFESQRRIAKMSSSWRKTPPVGKYRELWEIAHPVPYSDLIFPKEKQAELPAFLAYAIMQTESRFDPGQVSWAGAVGLMQLMPATARGVAKNLGLETSRERLQEPDFNLTLGIHQLSRLVRRWDTDEASIALAVPSYNAGPGSVDRWLGKRGDWDLDLFIEAIPFDETRSYTQSVLERWFTYRWLYGQGTPSERLPYLPLKIPSRKTG